MPNILYDAAYVTAGFEANRGNAARLNTNEGVAARVAELQCRAADKAVITAADIARQLDEDREFARKHKQASAAVSASMGKAKVLGLVKTKHEHTGPGGGPLQTVDLTHASPEQLAALEAIFGPLALASGDDEGDPGGEG